jgi:signal peptidase II
MSAFASSAARARRGPKALTLAVVSLVLLTAVDLWSKHWAEQELSRDQTREVPAACMPDEDGRTYMQRVRTRAVVLIDGYLEFRYAENCGAAFGMLDEAPKWLRASVFLTAALVAIGALTWMFFSGSGGVLFAWSVPLIVSGAIGNMVDRLRLGYVVDFIRFHIYDKFEYPTFNIADSTITVGVVLILIDGWLVSKSSASTKAVDRPEPA